jgi:hypothetical protein
VAQSKNTFADMLLGQFHAWLRNSQSLLHDDALLGYVHHLLKKVPAGCSWVAAPVFTLARSSSSTWCSGSRSWVRL